MFHRAFIFYKRMLEPGHIGSLILLYVTVDAVVVELEAFEM